MPTENLQYISTTLIKTLWAIITYIFQRSEPRFREVNLMERQSWQMAEPEVMCVSTAKNSTQVSLIRSGAYSLFQKIDQTCGPENLSHLQPGDQKYRKNLDSE